MTNTSEDKIEDEALRYARKNKERIAREYASREIYPSDRAPVAVFMAGSPGAGKTEFSKRVLEVIETQGKRAVRIDPDELRDCFKQYTGKNSYLFQGGLSILVGKIIDHVTKHDQNFILDGTFSNFNQAKKNIERALKHGRDIEIFYIFQDPVSAWSVAKKRERKEGRMVPKDAFIEHFFNAQKVVNDLKKEFGKKVELNLVIQNIENRTFTYKENIPSIDSYIPKMYTRDTLREILKDI